MRKSHSSLALLLLALSATSSYYATNASQVSWDQANNYDDGDKLHLLQLAPDTPPSLDDPGSSSPSSTPSNPATDTPPSPSDGPIDTGASSPSSTPGSDSGGPSQNVPTDSTTDAVSPPPAASNSNKLTIILGTSVPSSLILTTILGILARRRHKRKSGKKGQAKGSNGALVEVAVNIGGAAKQ